MKLPELKSRSQDESVLPLINIVFLLLIFFMIAGTLTRPELFPVEPPESRGEAEPEGDGLELLLDADGRLALENTPVTLEDLGARLKEHGEDTPHVRLKADAEVPAHRLMAVMDALRGAGVDKLTLLTQRNG